MIKRLISIILIIVLNVIVTSCNNCIEDKVTYNIFDNIIVNDSQYEIDVKVFYFNYNNKLECKEKRLGHKQCLTIRFEVFSAFVFAPFEEIDSIQIAGIENSKTIIFKPNDNNKYSPFLSENCDSTYTKKDFLYKYNYYVKDEIFE